MSLPPERGEFREHGIDRLDSGVDSSGVAVIIRITCDHRPRGGLDGIGGGLIEPDAQRVVGGIVRNPDLRNGRTRGRNETAARVRRDDWDAWMLGVIGAN